MVDLSLVDGGHHLLVADDRSLGMPADVAEPGSLSRGG
jgi:hypothetical protein